MAGESERMKRAGLNYLARKLSDIRKRVSGLEETARIQTYETLQHQLIWLELDIRSLRDKLSDIQNQGDLLEDASSKNPD